MSALEEQLLAYTAKQIEKRNEHKLRRDDDHSIVYFHQDVIAGLLSILGYTPPRSIEWHEPYPSIDELPRRDDLKPGDCFWLPVISLGDDRYAIINTEGTTFFARSLGDAELRDIVRGGGVGATLKIGDRVIKNPATWVPNAFDTWGRGIGVGVILPDTDGICGDGCFDVRWPGGRCAERAIQLLPEPAKKES